MDHLQNEQNEQSPETATQEAPPVQETQVNPPIVDEKVAKKAQAEADKAAKKKANDDAKVEKARLKKEAEDKKEADKLAKANAAAVPVAKDAKNGIARPKAGVTKLVWDTADNLSKESKAPVERAVLTAALNGEVQTGTIHTQYGRWRKYYGLSETRDERRARLNTIRDQKTAEKAEAKTKKDAEKVAKATAAAEAAKVAEAAKQPEVAPETAPAEAPADVQSEANAAGADAATE